MKYRLEEICEFITDGTHQTPEYCEEGGVIFLSSKDVTTRKIDWNNVKYIPESLHEKLCVRLRPKKNDILLAKNGTTGVAALVDKDEIFDVYVSLAVLRPKEIVYPKYLLYAINSPVAKRQFDAELKGVGVPNLHLNVIRKTEVNIENYKEQIRVCKNLDKVATIVDLRKKELEKLDELLNARFVEMFGDPVSNPYGYDKVALSDLADIKIGPFGSLLHKEDYIDGGHPLLNPSHIIDSKVSPDDKLTISDEKYEELSAYQLKTGDVVMGRRGEMGRCAVVPEDGFLCGTGSMLIRTKGEVTADYIQKIISFPSFKKTIEDMAVGQTMPNLNVPIVSGFQIIKPPMEVQDRYYAFAEQVNKSKVEIQKALDKTQMLFDSLMQEYFG